MRNHRSRCARVYTAPPQLSTYAGENEKGRTIDRHEPGEDAYPRVQGADVRTSTSLQLPGDYRVLSGVDRLLTGVRNDLG